MDIIFDEIFRALGYLFIAGVAGAAWKIAYDQAKETGFKKVLWKSLLWCGGIALFASITLGSSTCTSYSPGPFGGDCDYRTGGYEVTTEEQVANFAYFMTFLYIPAAFGALSAPKRKNKGDKHLSELDNEE